MSDLTVIVSSWERPRFLAEALGSIAAQRGPYQIQTIIVDDGSGKETRRVIEAWAKRLNPCEVLYEEPVPLEQRRATSRLPMLINKALALAKGLYISYLPDDDVWLPERTERMISWLDRHPHVFLLYHFIRFYQTSPDGRVGDLFVDLHDPWTEATEYWMRHISNRIDHTSVCHRNLGGAMPRWDEDPEWIKCPDWRFLLRCLESGLVFAAVHEYLAEGRKIAGQSLNYEGVAGIRR